MSTRPVHGQPFKLWGEGAIETTLTPYFAAASAPRGAVVVCPGGGYCHLADHEGQPIAEWLNQVGMHAFVVKYRVAPHRHPAPLHDAQRALRLVRANAAAWGVIPGKLGILGFSAGGHLTATAGTHFDAGDPAAADPVQRQSCRPDFLVLCYAVVSFGQLGHGGSAKNLLGENPPADLLQNLSNETQVTPQTPPAFIWHTGDDQAVPVENSLLFASALRQNGVPFALHVFPHGRHGVGLAADNPVLRAWPELCAAWLQESGFVG